ncbi:ABC transporter permease [Microbacterium sp. JB110]|uniref:ABC transporter permease n=1 Tax=Microbacterium sp. JB110 TaxID=2024477 RepID=UPI00097F2014|nr:ABC transporter permease [Microbacterium sp. JB110]RCS61223.1 ABC transporter permease [Microbacterium sp. JB110]SJM69270.1 AttF component of AttEFGH ABC transport system / AttG component of AttEFGH ABC transport system [Frigoribacterium sp. JB110]
MSVVAQEDATTGSGRRSLMLRLARRDIRRNLPRFVLAALVIAITISAGTAVDVLLRSAEVSDAGYAQRTLGDSAVARVQWWGDEVQQQTPRADVGVTAGADAPVGEVEARLQDLLTSDTRLLKTHTGAVVLRSGSSLTDGMAALQGPLTDPLLTGVIDIWQGRLPHARGEVSVSRTVAERLDLSVGDAFEGSADSAARMTSLTLVGIHENNPLGFDVALAEKSLLKEGTTYLDGARSVWFVDGAPVVWSGVLALNDAGFIAISRDVVLDPPAATDVPMYRDGAAVEADTRLGMAILVTAAVLVGGTLVALLIGPVFAIGARQSRRDYGLLAAQGATGRDIVGVMLRSTLIVAVLGSVAGVLLGVAVASVVVAVAQAVGSTAFPNLIVPGIDLVLLLVFGVLVALVAARGPARRAAREDPVISLRDITDAPGRAPRTRRLLVVVLSGLVIALLVVTAVTGVRVWLVLVGPLATIMLVLVVRGLLPVLGRIARRAQTPERIAIRDTARRGDRTVPTITGIAAAVALAVAVSVVTATQYATAAAEWHPRAATGTVMIYDGFYTDSSGSENPFEASTSESSAGAESTVTGTEQRARITTVLAEFLPGTELIDVDMLSLDEDAFPRLLIDPDTECPAWADFTEEYNQYNTSHPDPDGRADVNGMNCLIDKALSDINKQPTWDSTDHTNLVVDDGTLVAGLGLPGAEEAAEALRSGKIVLTRPIDQWPDGTAHLGIMEDDHDGLTQWRAQLNQARERGEDFYENPPEPIAIDTLVADAIVMDWPSQQWAAFIPPELLSEAPLSDHDPAVEHVGMIATATAVLSETEVDELRDRLLLLGVHHVTTARDYANAGLSTALTTLTVIAALIALTATIGTARIALTDMRRDLRVLRDVGAPRGTRRRIRGATTFTVGILGGLTGTVAGIVLGVTIAASIAAEAATEKGAWTLTVPWLPALLITVATPLLATAIIAFRDTNGDD